MEISKIWDAINTNDKKLNDKYDRIVRRQDDGPIVNSEAKEIRAVATGAETLAEGTSDNVQALRQRIVELEAFTKDILRVVPQNSRW
jgi:hypothetical protein